MTLIRSVLFGGAIFALAGLTSVAFSQGAPEAPQVLQQRQAMMKAIGGNLKALNEISKGERTESMQDVSRRAREVSEAAKQISVMFKPEFHTANVGSDLKTSASEKIWKEPEQFTASANRLELASTQLAAAADANDQEKMKLAIADMAKTCGGCHELYRVKK